MGYRLSYGTAPGNYSTTRRRREPDNGRTDGIAARASGTTSSSVPTTWTESPPSDEVSGRGGWSRGAHLDGDVLNDPDRRAGHLDRSRLRRPDARIRFWRQDQATGTWNIVQDYSSQNSFTWTPAIGEEGTYVIRVWVHVPGSSEAFDARRSTSPFTVSNAGVKIGALEADVALPAPVGSPITFKARATGGPAPLEYRFYRFNRVTSTWTMLRDYSPIDSYHLDTHRRRAGILYTLQVWVRGAGSTAAYDDWRSSDTFAIADGPTQHRDCQTETSFPAASGAPITWKVWRAAVPVRCNFVSIDSPVRPARGRSLQDYGPSNTYTWTPTASDEGAYVLQAWVQTCRIDRGL